MAYTAVTYTFSNSTTSDATQVNQNFTDLVNGLSDGTKDISIAALTVAGTATLNGAINLGNATTDDLTITAYMASSLIPKTNQTYDIGTVDLGLRALYLGVASAGALTAKVIASASIAADRIFTVPEAGTDASFVMTAGTQTISGAKTFDTAGAIKGVSSGSGVATYYIGEYLESIGSNTAITSQQYDDGAASGLSLTAGIWDIQGTMLFLPASTTTVTDLLVGIGTVTGNSGTGIDASRNRCSRSGGTVTLTTGATDADTVMVTPLYRVNISSTTTYYVKAYAKFSVSTMQAKGFICARRVA
jgi:hypothetical protein